MDGAAWRGAALTVKANPSGFGAEITGVDLTRPLSPNALAAVRRAWTEHSVIWFPDQVLTDDELEAVTLQFGPFGQDPFIEPMPGRPHVLELRREADETSSPFGAAWHSDWSFQPQPPSATLLYAKLVPPRGGDTLFADGYRAFETLSPLLQRMLDGLRGVHSAVRAYGPSGAYARETAPRAMRILTGPDAERTHAHPIVRSHPVSGRKALFVNPVYTVGIEGMEEGEARAMLTFLFKHMVEDAFVYRHKWRSDMLTVWDNRCLMHNATGGYDGHARVMHRTTVAGETPI